MYNVNNNGPSMDPWGTPYDMSILSDVTFSRDTDWVLSVKLDVNQLSSSPRIP